MFKAPSKCHLSRWHTPLHQLPDHNSRMYGPRYCSFRLYFLIACVHFRNTLQSPVQQIQTNEQGDVSSPDSNNVASLADGNDVSTFMSRDVDIPGGWLDCFPQEEQPNSLSYRDCRIAATEFASRFFTQSFYTLTHSGLKPGKLAINTPWAYPRGNSQMRVDYVPKDAAPAVRPSVISAIGQHICEQCTSNAIQSENGWGGDYTFGNQAGDIITVAMTSTQKDENPVSAGNKELRGVTELADLSKRDNHRRMNAELTPRSRVLERANSFQESSAIISRSSKDLPLQLKDPSMHKPLAKRSVAPDDTGYLPPALQEIQGSASTSNSTPLRIDMPGIYRCYEVWEQTHVLDNNHCQAAAYDFVNTYHHQDSQYVMYKFVPYKRKGVRSIWAPWKKTNEELKMVVDYAPLRRWPLVDPMGITDTALRVCDQCTPRPGNPSHGFGGYWEGDVADISNPDNKARVRILMTHNSFSEGVGLQANTTGTDQAFDIA